MSSETFQQVLERRNELLHRKSVLKELLDHLSKFLDTDAALAKNGITTEGEGLVVPQEIISKLRGEFTETLMAEVLKELNQINTSKVAENGNQETKQEGDVKKGGSKKKARPETGKQGRAKTKDVAGSKSRSTGADSQPE